MFENVFFQIAAILGVAAVAGAGALLLRQPLIVAFIAVGILLGPAAWAGLWRVGRSSCSPGSASRCCCSSWA